MGNQSKEARGQLLDFANRNILSEILVEINLIQSESDYPEYRVFGAIQGYKPELANKSHILKFREEISGELFISIDGMPDMTQTRFKVFLQDPSWSNLDWFQSL